MEIELGLLVASFFIVFLAELGDKTQLVAFSLTSTAKSPLIVFLASSLALVLSSVSAAVLGGLAAQLIQEFASYLSVVLFMIFGLYILLAKEPPPIKECFLETIAFENAILKKTKRLFKKEGLLTSELEGIIQEESGHQKILKALLRRKELFRDDINQEEEALKKMQSEFKIPKIDGKGFKDALSAIIKAEEATLRMYQFFDEHLSQEHHLQDDLVAIIKDLIKEEERHIAYFLHCLGTKNLGTKNE